MPESATQRNPFPFTLIKLRVIHLKSRLKYLSYTGGVSTAHYALSIDFGRKSWRQNTEWRKEGQEEPKASHKNQRKERSTDLKQKSESRITPVNTEES